LVEEAAWTMLLRGECATLLSWLDALPADLVPSRPRLGVLWAWALAYAGRLGRVEMCLADVDLEPVRGEVAAVRAFVAGVRGDVPRAIELARQASKDLSEDNLPLRGIVAQILGIAQWNSGDLTGANRAMVEAIALNRRANRPYLALMAMTILGHIQEMQGALNAAADSHREALKLSEESSSRPVPFAGMAYVGLAEVFYEWNDLDGAKHHALEGIRLSELGGRESYRLAGDIALARIYQAHGDLDRALETVHDAARRAKRYGSSYMEAEVAELRARLWVRQGNVAASSHWAQEHSSSLNDVRNPTIAGEVEQMAVVWVLIAEGKAGQALDLLARLLDARQAAGPIKGMIKTRTYQALAYQGQGNLDQAMYALSHALTLAEPEGFVRTFVDEGELMARLLRLALSRGIAPNYVARLLAAFGDETEPIAPAMDALVEPLTEREREVLRLIVAGLSNPEIADQLVIAVSTVKSHVNHIFGKLAVDSRTRAVARARELNLL
jgi:LuxR family maltose regulon positive regulatory protein